MISLKDRKWYQWLYILGGLLCLVVGVGVREGSVANTLLWVFVGIVGVWSGTIPRKPDPTP